MARKHIYGSPWAESGAEPFEYRIPAPWLLWIPPLALFGVSAIGIFGLLFLGWGV